MTSYEVDWLGAATGSRATSVWWARLAAPIITAILVIALGITVFGLMTSDEADGAPASPAAAEAGLR